MKRVRVTMTYTATSSAEFEVPDDWECTSQLSCLTDDMVSELDANAKELWPSDWSAEEI